MQSAKYGVSIRFGEYQEIQSNIDNSKSQIFTLNFNLLVNAQSNIGVQQKGTVIVPDHESRDHDVVLVRLTIHLGNPLGVGKMEWGGNGEETGRGRSVYEQPGTKVDGFTPRKRRDIK